MTGTARPEIILELEPESDKEKEEEVDAKTAKYIKKK